MRLFAICSACIVALAFAPAARAANTSLKDAIKCSEFKHNADGTWYADSVSLNYGPGNNEQMNLFGTTIRPKKGHDSEPDMYSILNEKCGAAK